MNSTKPRLAVCLYGQPRSYITGFNNLSNYLNSRIQEEIIINIQIVGCNIYGNNPPFTYTRM